MLCSSVEGSSKQTTVRPSTSGQSVSTVHIFCLSLASITNTSGIIVSNHSNNNNNNNSNNTIINNENNNNNNDMLLIIVVVIIVTIMMI